MNCLNLAAQLRENAVEEDNATREALEAEKVAERQLLQSLLLLLLGRERLTVEVLLLLWSWTWSGMLPQHSRVLVQTAIH